MRLPRFCFPSIHRDRPADSMRWWWSRIGRAGNRTSPVPLMESRAETAAEGSSRHGAAPQPLTTNHFSVGDDMVMRGIRRITLALAAAALVPAAACSDSTGSGGKVGEVRFTYDGEESGTFQVRGSLTGSNADRGNYAVGGFDEGGVFVYAQKGRSGNRFDAVSIFVSDAEEGTYTCNQAVSCDFGAVVFLGYDLDSEDGAVYFSAAGRVTITEINDERVRGTFSFDMDDGFTEVTNGTFDVPLVDDDFASARAPMRPALPSR